MELTRGDTKDASDVVVTSANAKPNDVVVSSRDVTPSNQHFLEMFRQLFSQPGDVSAQDVEIYSKLAHSLLLLKQKDPPETEEAAGPSSQLTFEYSIKVSDYQFNTHLSDDFLNSPGLRLARQLRHADCMINELRRLKRKGHFTLQL